MLDVALYNKPPSTSSFNCYFVLNKIEIKLNAPDQGRENDWFSVP